MGSRDLRRIYAIDVKAWAVVEEAEAPGIPWAAASTGEDLWFTIGEDADDGQVIRPRALLRQAYGGQGHEGHGGNENPK